MEFKPTSRGGMMAEALNKIVERVPEARFVYVGVKSLHGQFRLSIQGRLYWVRYVNSFVVRPEEQLAQALYESMPRDAFSKAIEDRLNGIEADIGQAARDSAKITREDLAFTINCTTHGFKDAAMRTESNRGENDKG
jgi:fructose-specific component phosphotransferase system IIB-like protein